MEAATKSSYISRNMLNLYKQELEKKNGVVQPQKPPGKVFADEEVK
jgi:hypothetical protein